MNDVRSPIAGRPGPAISVIVPVHNIERYLPACLDSLLAQTHGDFEIVVVDDGSTDDCSAIIARYAADHPECVRAFSKPNGGLGDARNFGIDHSRGQLLAFVDGDDLVLPTFLSAMHEVANELQADIVICGIENFSGDESPGQGAFYPEPDMSVFGHSLAEEPRLLYRVDASACDKLYSRELFRRSGVRFPAGLRFEDVPTTYRLLPFANSIEKIDEPLYRYRRDRPASISGKYDARYLDLIEGLRMVDDAFRDAGIFEANRSELLRLHLTHLIAGRYPDLYLHSGARVRHRFISETFELLDERYSGWQATDTCRDLWGNPALRFASTHAWALEALCALPPRAYLGLVSRIGAFDPER